MLNAFRHLRFRHDRQRGRLGLVEGVLNAFRHLRFRHYAAGGGYEIVLELCSTPFGIWDFGMNVGVNGVDWGDECSTPFGIWDFGMRGALRTMVRHRDVLNAFRHLRFRH